MMATLLLSAGCKYEYQQDIISTGNTQKHVMADLEGDPNNRNILMVTTVLGEEFGFKLLVPDYWELKPDDKNEYNTDIYLSSNEYENDACIVLPGTIGYAVDASLEKEQWQTTTPFGLADDWYFYTDVSETERRPVMRIIQFSDLEENYYTLEARYPETGYENCNTDFSNMIATFDLLSIPIDQIDIKEEAVYQERWTIMAVKPYGDEEEKIIIDYPPDWEVTDNVEDVVRPLITDNETGCVTYLAVAPIDTTDYTEDVIVLDNNEMAKKYTLETGEEVIIVTHNEKTYYFALKNVAEDSIAICMEEFESVVKSFRTYDEEMTARGVVEESGTGTIE